MTQIDKKARVLAFYLPQFHPIPENDGWWGKGFTEWTNVGKAKPLFKGHYQPRVPADLGYYDLRMPEVREKQAEMAQKAGVEGFVYWHYWFGNGKRLLERPFNEVLKSGKPDFPFCLAWANETWSGIWHGAPERVLIEQTYPGIDDYINHFNSNLEAFLDKRYIKINDRCIFYIYCPFKIPNFKIFVDCWNDLAKKNGLNQLFFIARVNDKIEASKALELGFDAVQTNWLGEAMSRTNSIKDYWNRFSRKVLKNSWNLDIWDYSKLSPYLISPLDKQKEYFPTILAGWDNSPRSNKRGRILTNFTPTNFDIHVKQALKSIEPKTDSNKIVFLRSWNEWAEGNYIEPDLKFGNMFLDILEKNLKQI